MDVKEHLKQLTDWYGKNGADSCPTEAQWTNVLSRPADKPVTLINFFKLREIADYPGESIEVTGQEAFASYAAVSVPTMERVGGKFLFVGPFQGTFLGADEDWDLTAIGSYPDLHALVALYSDEAYREVFHHRTAACKRQKVLICGE